MAQSVPTLPLSATGFGIIFRDGEVTVGFLVDWVVFASSVVNVVTTGAQFLAGANGVCSLKHFSQSGDNSTVTSLEFVRGFQLPYLQAIAPSAEPVVEATQQTILTPLTNSCASSTFADGTLLNVTLDGNTFDGEAPLTGLFPGGNVATDEWFTIVTRPSSTEVGLPEDCSPEDRFTFSSNFGSYGDLTNCSRTFGGTNEPLDSALNNDSGGQSASGICSKAMNVY